MDRAFLDPPLTPRNLDRYGARTAILRALQAVRPRLTGRLLDVGCGRMPYQPLLEAAPSGVTEYLGLDLPDSGSAYGARPELVWDGSRIPLDDASVDCAVATEVLEHAPDPEALLREVRRVLRPGGMLFFTVPFLWPLHEAPHDQYRYTPWALERHLGAAGFTDVELRALGGWDASLATMLGLWVRRRPMPRPVRVVLSVLLTPVVALLQRLDRAPGLEGDAMITALAGTARRAP